MEKYKQRVADLLLARKLAGKGAVLVVGPKWCGKTTTAKQQSHSLLDLSKKLILNQSLQMMDINPESLLVGDTPRLIDEWQQIPALWDVVRTEVDERNEFGQFVLTGSAVLPKAEDTLHSGTGRIGRLKMRPMSLFESGESTGDVSLTDLFNKADIPVIQHNKSLEEIAFLTCRGGWPQATFLQGDIALDQAEDYVESLLNVDMHRVDKVQRSSERMRYIMRSYARHQGAQCPISMIREDLLGSDGQSISDDTITSYLGVLNSLYVIEDMPAWNPNLRSKAAIRTSATRYYIDPSIATATLGIAPKDLINDLRTFGFMFETMAVRDIRVYADALKAKVYHFRDSNGLECDTVIHRRDGSYGLIEIKLGGPNNIEQAATNLQTLANTIDTEKMAAPSFMMVLTAIGPYAYRRKDGVYVVPLACLKP
jgi:predicted AAA+ superfamily ATPase